MSASVGCGADCGQCNVSQPERPFCECTWPKVNVGDLAPDPSRDCFIRQDAVTAMQAVGVLLWVAAFVICMLACANAQRSNSNSAKSERKVMLWLVAGSALNAAWEARIASSSYPGEFSLTLDLTTTLLFYFGNSITYSFIFSLPFVRSGTSVVPFAFQEAFPNNRKHVLGIAIGLFVFSQLVHTMLFVIYVFPQHSQLLITVYYALSAVWGGLLSIIFAIVTSHMVRRLRTMVNARDLPAYHRTKLTLTLKSAEKVRQVSLVASLLIVPPLLAFAASPVVQRFSYVYVPIVSYTFAIIILRHGIKSVLISRFVASQSTSDMRSQGGQKQQDPPSGDDKDNGGSVGEEGAANKARLGALGKRTNKFKKISLRRQMTRVTEEPSHAAAGGGEVESQILTVVGEDLVRPSM